MTKSSFRAWRRLKSTEIIYRMAEEGQQQEYTALLKSFAEKNKTNCSWRRCMSKESFYFV